MVAEGFAVQTLEFGSLGKNGGLPAIVVSEGRKRISPEHAQ